MKDIDSILEELLELARNKRLNVHHRLEAYRLYLAAVIQNVNFESVSARQIK